jgi:hypothetical protein
VTGRLTYRLGVCLLPVVMVFAVAQGVARGASPPGPAWQVSLAKQGAAYVVVLTNIGSVPSSGPVTIADTLPVGATINGRIEGKNKDGNDWEGCSIVGGRVVVTCVYDPVVPALGQSTVLVIPVGGEPPGVATDIATVSGGGAPVATVSRSTDGGSFGFLDFASQASDLSGAPDTEAGSHPNALTTTFDLLSGQIPKAMELELPAGLIGNPQSTPACPITSVFSRTCPTSSRIGTFFVNFAQGLFLEDSAFPIYNVVPERGYPAELGFYAEGIAKPVFMYGSLGAGPGYRLHLTVPDLPKAAESSSVIATIFGNPAGMNNPPGVVENSSVPFLTSPSDCSGARLETNIEVYTWEVPTIPEAKSNADALPVAGCDRLRFDALIGSGPETTLADEPSGYTFDLRVPQSQSAGVEGLATPPVKDVTVALPQGVSLSPAAADGLVACPAEGPEGINVSQPGLGNCPLASQVGTAEALTPLLPEPLHGQVYVTEPGCGGPGQKGCEEKDAVDGNLYGLYLQLEGSGIAIKLHGTVSANPANGQLTAAFRDAPQQPFSDLQIHLKGGQRAPMANPQTCGEAVTLADVAPWSSPETPDANPTSSFTVTGCDGSPFTPSFEAGTTDPTAGAYTDVAATFSRGDRQQDLSDVQVQAPPGLAAMISHVPLCEEPQAARGECASASQIGSAMASSGAGSDPHWVSGPVYLTGPYRGAPFGLSVAIAAKAGPFNLGTIVRRATLNIDPHTAAATITSDPLPQIWDGVPLRVQTVNVTLNRPRFAFNPTNCEAKQMTAAIASAQGAVAHVSSPFAAGGCKNLAFTPKLTASSRSEVSKVKGAALDIKASFTAGQANTRGVTLTFPEQLPARLTTIQQACPAATFAANPSRCPSGSVIGVTNVHTPVLSAALAGPVYLVSHGGAAFPDVDLVLQGDGVRVDVVSSINIKKGVTTTTIADAPDAPISSFEVRLPRGSHSAFAANGSLCAKPLAMPTTFIGQNGRRLASTTKIAVEGCPKKTKKRTIKGRAKARKALAGDQFHIAIQERGR